MVTEKTLISFDYAIKYLLKDKGDHSVIESFISAVLKTRGYKPVKIIALLESESNKESKYKKSSTADCYFWHWHNFVKIVSCYPSKVMVKHLLIL